MYSSVKETLTAPTHGRSVPAHDLPADANVSSGSLGDSSPTPSGNHVIHPNSSPIVTVATDDRTTLDARIDDAVESMITHALQEQRSGILVTRHSLGHISVKLSSAVPYGETHELAID